MDRPRRQQAQPEGEREERGFVIGPVEGASDINFDPPSYIGE